MKMIVAGEMLPSRSGIFSKQSALYSSVLGQSNAQKIIPQHLFGAIHLVHVCVCVCLCVCVLCVCRCVCVYFLSP